MASRHTLALLAALVPVACATGGESLGPDGAGSPDRGVVQDAGADGYVWPDLGTPPDAFIWPDGLPDIPTQDDIGPPDAGPPDSGGGTCPDPFEPNETCTAGKSLGSTQEGSSWVSKTATSDPAGDVDWFTADGEESGGFCLPGTSQCFYFKARLQVPVGRRLKICLMKDSCGASPTCADNTTTPGPVQLNVQYKVDGTCALNDDTYAKIWVEQLDATGGCDSYTISFNFDEC